MGQVADFLRLIYGGNGQFPGRVALWRVEHRRDGGEGRKITEWVTPDTLDRADALADECRRGDGYDLYYGVCPMGEHVVIGRGKHDDTVACPGVWVDLDFANSAAKKRSRRKYPSREHAEQLLARLPAQPSLVVDTGGGWHVYWLFHEVEPLDTADRRALMARIVAGWQRHVARELERLGGYELDPTQDLPRVLRPAGAWSCRWGRNVQIVESYGLVDWRHYPADLEALIPEELAAGTASQPVRVESSAAAFDFTVDPQAEASSDLVDTLKNNDADFRMLWDHKRVIGSSSEQELAIANIAALAGWTPQQIVNLLITHRRRHEPEKMGKVTRPDYLRVTVGKALKFAAQHKALSVTPEELQLYDAARAPNAPQEVVDASRNDALRKLSSLLGITVLGCSQLGRSRNTARYYLTVADQNSDCGEREIEIGPVSAITSGPRALVDALFAEARHQVPAISRKDWDAVKERLLRISHLTELADDDELSAAVDMLREVLARATQIDDTPSGRNAKAGAIRAGLPFVEAGVAYVTTHDMLRYARTRGVDQWTRASLIRAMHRMGWAQQTLNWRHDGRHSTRSYFALPTARLVKIGAATGQDADPIGANSE